MEKTVITSLQNDKIKHIVLLQQKSSERKRTGLFVVEGQRELMHCMDAGYEVESIFWCKSLAPDFRPQINTDYYCVSKEVYEKIAYRSSTEGVIAIVHQKNLTLNDLTWKGNPVFIIIESVEKPGNLGAILRTADAANIDGVIVCDPLTDLYNPNLIRASLGAVFTVPVISCESAECIDFLKRNSIQILTAQLQDSSMYYDIDMCLPTAIVMGTESTGLTDKWRQAADAHIRIPMLGKMDSLNVSVSAAILIFEAVRQRLQK